MLRRPRFVIAGVIAAVFPAVGCAVSPVVRATDPVRLGDQQRKQSDGDETSPASGGRTRPR